MKKRIISLLLIAVMVLGMVGCGSSSEEPAEDAAVEEATDTTAVANAKALADQDFDTSYQPAKDTYKIYMTYKLVHAWYDSIGVGVKAAVEDLAAKGVTIDYVWEAPVEPDAIDQVNRIETAVGQGYDMICVDINQLETTQPAVNDAVAAGVPVAIFGGADIEDSDRAFFVGNTDNYGDGATLAKAVCEKMMEEGKTQIALLTGTIGATSHEQRRDAFYDVIAEYPEIEIVDDQRDNDFVEEAITITEAWLQAYPELGGILANNMSNPVGACQAVKDAGKSGEIVIGGMDHDLRTLEYLKDGTLYIAQVQNCYDMGYKTVWNAVKTIDGVELDEVVTSVGSTSVFQDEAQTFIDMLY